MCEDYCEGVACKDYDMCDQPKWKPFPDIQPLPKMNGKNVIGEFIVTLQLINKDKNDDDVVAVAVWCCEDQSWRYMLNHNLKYGDHGWKVIAWTFKPAPYKKM